MQELKGKLVEAFLLALFATLLSAVADFWVDGKLGTRALLTIGKPLIVDGKAFVPFSIENPRESTIDDLQLAVPVDVGPVLRSEPVTTELQQAPGASRATMLLGDVPARSRVHLMLGMRNLETARILSVINAAERRIDVQQPHEIQSSLVKQVAIGAIPNGIIYFIAFLVFEFFRARSRQVMLERIDSLKQELAGNRREIVDTRAEATKAQDWLKDIERRRAQERAVLYYRLNKYREELSFWKDTIRKSLAELSDDRMQTIFRGVSATLKTYITQRDDLDLFAFEEAVNNADLRDAFAQTAPALERTK